MNSKSPTFYTWTEDLAGRGSVEVGSALLSYLDSLEYDDIRVVRLLLRWLWRAEFMLSVTGSSS